MLEVKKSGLATICLVLIVSLSPILVSCTNSSATTTINPPVMSAADTVLLESAYDDYEAMRHTLSPGETRTKLLDSLKNQVRGVKSAELWEDGYSIFVEYSDGDCALIDTLQAEELYSGPKTNPAALSPDSNYGSSAASSHKIIPVSFMNGGTQSSSPNFAPADPSQVSKTFPKSRKVLLLGPDEWNAPRDIPLHIRDSFLANGWPESDVKVKLNTGAPWSLAALNIKPDDYFNWSEYGIILFFGHGSARQAIDPTGMYLQFCFLDDGSFQQDKRLSEWKADRRIVVSRSWSDEETGVRNYQTSIRLDFLGQMIGALPGSYISLATCYSDYFSNVFLDHGAGVFLGWNGAVDPWVSDNNQFTIMNLMLETNCSAFEAYSDASVTKEWNGDIYAPPENIVIERVTAFAIRGRSDNAYSIHLPAWVHLKVTGIPPASTLYQINLDIYVNDSTGYKMFAFFGGPLLHGQNEIDTETFSGTTGYYPLGRCRINARVVNENSDDWDTFAELLFCTIKAGENDILIENLTFVSSKTPTPTVSYSPTATATPTIPTPAETPAPTTSEPGPASPPEPTPAPGTLASPNGMGVAGPAVWVANRGGNSVTKLNVITGSVIGTYPVGAAPRRICYDGSHIWVTNSSSNSVTKLNASDGSLVCTYQVGSEPGPICFDGANIWVANNAGNDVTKLKASDGSLLGTYPVGNGPGAICFDGSNIWVALFAGNTVVKVRPDDGSILGSYTAGDAPSGICFDGTNIWVVNNGSNNVTKLRARDGILVGSYAVGSKPRNCCFDGFDIWVANSESNSITRLSASDGRYVRSYKAGTQPFDIVAAGDIWVTNMGSNDMTRIPLNP